MSPDQQPVTQQQLKEALAAQRDELIEAMRDMQTEMLRGMERFSRGNFSRMHGFEVADQVLNERLNALEERVLALETRPRT